MNSIQKHLLFVCILTSVAFFSQGQSFQINGDVTALGDNCFELTPAQDGKSGSIWFIPKINLNESFDFIADFNFGCSNSGADGLTFALHTDPNGLGGGGHGQGFQYLWPSMAVEFDSFKNNGENDPSDDHMAILANGEVNHLSANNLAGPVSTDPNDGNVEDCDYHEIRITWDALTQQMNAYFDCELRLTYTGDIVQQFFQGDPMVHWGFTAATGARNNRQIVCVKQFEIIEPLPDYTMCPGGNIQLQAAGGQSYCWSPAEALNNPNIANPLATPTENTTYYLTIKDDCVEFYDTLDIVIAGDSVAFGFADTSLCQGEPLLLDATTNNASYAWSTGATTPTISPVSSGYYVVTVTVNDECISNDGAQVHFIKLPVILFSEYPTICPGETITLNAYLPDATYEWQDGSTDSVYHVTQAGTYTVMLSHFCGNKTLSTDIGFEASCTDVYIPNVFSPNFDGINDYFVIQDGGDIEQIHFFRIVSRWGEVVFEAKEFLPNDRNFGWDGTFNGEEMGAGVYVYFTEITFRDGSRVILSGDVTILR